MVQSILYSFILSIYYGYSTACSRMASSIVLASKTSTPASSISNLTEVVRCNGDLPLVWSKLEDALSNHFGFVLFTVLIFSPTQRVFRIHSTRLDLHPLGQRQVLSAGKDDPVQRQDLLQRVVVEGRIWRGCTKEDLKAVFEDWKLLWDAGLGSVLNIPVRLDGVTIGSLNILDKEHAYDAADLELADQIAKVVAPSVQRVRQTIG